MKRKVALHNLGCKVNAYETEAMQQLLEAAGYEIVPFAPGADIYVINTCTVTNIADRKSRQMLHRAKKMNPDAIVVAAGCYVQAGREKAEADPSIDLIIGNNKKQDLVSVLEAYQKGRARKEEIIDIAQSVLCLLYDSICPGKGAQQEDCGRGKGSGKTGSFRMSGGGSDRYPLKFLRNRAKGGWGKSSDAYPGSAPGGGNRKNPSGLSGPADRHGKLCGKPVPSAEDLPSFSSFPAKRLHLHPEADEPSLYGGRI